MPSSAEKRSHIQLTNIASVPGTVASVGDATQGRSKGMLAAKSPPP